MIEFKVSELQVAIAAAEGASVEFTSILVARNRLTEMAAALELARRIKKVNYQVGAVMRAARCTGKLFEVARLVQWLVYAVEPSTAAKLDAETMRQAREYVEEVGTENQREIARLCGKCEKLKRLAEASPEAGEQENAESLFLQTRASLEGRFESEDKFTLVGWAPR